MKAPTLFWPLLKNELAFNILGGTGPVAFTLFMYGLGVAALPLAALFFDSNSRGNISTLFAAGFLPVIAFLILSCVNVWVAYAIAPALRQILPSGDACQYMGAFEFLFTRAVNRRMLFRARATAFYIFVLTPFFLSVAVSPFVPGVRFGNPSNEWRTALYLKAFPASLATNVPGQMIIPHGAVAYTLWLAWSGTLAFMLLQAYGILAARWIKPDKWWTALYAGAPILLTFGMLLLTARDSQKTHVSICENSFLLFATHPLAMILALAALAVVVQIWCERRFSQLEIL